MEKKSVDIKIEKEIKLEWHLMCNCGVLVLNEQSLLKLSCVCVI